MLKKTEGDTGASCFNYTCLRPLTLPIGKYLTAIGTLKRVLFSQDEPILHSFFSVQLKIKFTESWKLILRKVAYIISSTSLQNGSHFVSLFPSIFLCTVDLRNHPVFIYLCLYYLYFLLSFSNHFLVCKLSRLVNSALHYREIRQHFSGKLTQ